MSTRSRIGYFENEIVKSVYCHCDGYLEHNGHILFEYYPTLDDVKALVNLGDLSSLGETLESTRSYHNWRGEDINIKTNYGEDDFWNCAFDCCEEYAYLFKGGRWFYMRDDNCDEVYDLEGSLKELKDKAFIYNMEVSTAMGNVETDLKKVRALMKANFDYELLPTIDEVLNTIYRTTEKIWERNC